MEYADVFVSGVGLWLPPPTLVSEVAEQGVVEARTIRRSGLRSVCIGSLSGPDMAAAAARRVVRSSATDPEDIGLLLHASTYFQGHDLWAPASYVQRLALGNSCPAMEVRQLSNGGMAALELAVAHLRSAHDRHSTLITTGDRFCPPGFDRWLTDPGTVCGDGGTALLLSRAGGFARLLSLVTLSDPTLESMGRGTDPFADVPLGMRSPISVVSAREHLIKEIGLTNLLERLRSGQRSAFDQALDRAGVKASDIDWFALPNLGRPKMEAQFFEPLDIAPERTTWEWGASVGHLGAGDPFAGLAQLTRTGALEPGRLCALVSAGGGFSWSVAVLEVIHEPDPLSAFPDEL